MKNRGLKTEVYTPFLTNKMIEDQVIKDLISYQRAIRGSLTHPVFPDEVIEKVWGVTVDYLDEVLSKDGEQVLACFDPGAKKVYLNNSIRGTEGMVSFTLAHEAGHISLHNFLSKLYNRGTFCVGSFFEKTETKMLERQADKYASLLLMPQEVIFSQLRQCGYDFRGSFDLALHGRFLKDFFGVSFEAMERRLSDLGITTVGGFYKNKTKKSLDRFFDDKEAERTLWLSDERGQAQ